MNSKNYTTMFDRLQPGDRFYWRWQPSQLYIKRDDLMASYERDGKTFYQSIMPGEMVEPVKDE